jgi:hypothetical protein
MLDADFLSALEYVAAVEFVISGDVHVGIYLFVVHAGVPLVLVLIFIALYSVAEPDVSSVLPSTRS